jgi:hypothetical protein
MYCLGCGRTIETGTRQCRYCGYAADRYAFVNQPENGNRVRLHCHSGSCGPFASPPLRECEYSGSDQGPADAAGGTHKLLIGDDDFVPVPTYSIPNREGRFSLPLRHGIGAQSRHYFLFFALLGSVGLFGLVAWLMA